LIGKKLKLRADWPVSEASLHLLIAANNFLNQNDIGRERVQPIAHAA
jgi:hypothetical protein